MSSENPAGLPADWHEKMWLYIAGELPAPEMQAFETQLRENPALALELREAQQTLAAYSRLPKADLDDQRYAAAVQAATGRRPRIALQRRWPLVRPLRLAAVAAMAAVVLVFLFARPHRRTEFMAWDAAALETELLRFEHSLDQFPELASDPFDGRDNAGAAGLDADIGWLAQRISALELQLADDR